jgi:thiamine kinase-like enzyme
MSKRDWVIAVAFGLALLLAFGVAGYQLGKGIGELRGEGETKAQYYAEHTGYEIQRTCLGLDAVAQAECVERIVKASNEYQRAEYDLIAQSEMSTWAFWMLWVTLGMALVTTVGVYYVWRTLKATQDIGVAQTRPWLSP